VLLEEYVFICHYDVTSNDVLNLDVFLCPQIDSE
jgi:hypothetical protein